MKTNEDLYLKIHHYLHNQLSTVDKQIFEKELATNTELANEVKLHSHLNELVIDAQLIDIKNISKNVVKSKNTSLNVKKWFGGMGALAIVLGTGLYYYENTNNKTIKPTTNSTQSTDFQLKKNNVSKIDSSRKNIKSKPITTQFQTEKPVLKTDSLNKKELDKIAQYEFLKQLDKPKTVIENTVQPIVINKETFTSAESKNIKKQPLHKNIDTTIQNNNSKLIFDIPYNISTDIEIELDIPQNTNYYKITTNTGTVIYEAAVVESPLYWNINKSKVTIKSNSELTVWLLDQHKNNLGIGKISILE